uniref:Glutathione S-transferase n=1 Tax=Vombatus ursinus TaxID=29139 RepID=A0A4X2L719_VOMUR
GPPCLGLLPCSGFTPAACPLLEYTGANYEEKVYHFGDAPDFDKSQWLDVKFSLGLDFPNVGTFISYCLADLSLLLFQLPYLIDGDHKITQSSAILRYIWGGGHAGMNHVMDVRLQLSWVCHNPDFEVLKIEYLEQLPGQLKLFSLFLGKWTWFAGDKITYVDFLVCDVLDQNRKFDPCCLDDFANLKAFLDQFEGLSRIAAYLASDRCQPYPIFAKIACWGNK